MLAQLLAKQKERAAKFAEAIEQLRDPDTAFTADIIYSLSDMDREQLATFHDVWAALSVERRRKLIARLVETAETNFDLDFSAIINPAITDPDAEIRKAAIEGVIEDTAPRRVIETLIRVANDDPFSEVREVAVQALGPFVLQGELGKLPDKLNQRLQDTVWTLYNNLDEALDVRRRALEALGNCGRAGVADLIREAYFADEQPMRASAIFAMGRSCDEVWAEIVLDELSSEQAEM
ncbi:MAG: HEAT repeat domain-containing protein, partial [Anaerolineae bacterium]|nr:HEAT repeat domain-containing protein [Anaerolineae bacterium]